MRLRVEPVVSAWFGCRCCRAREHLARVSGDFSDLVVWRESAALAASVIRRCRGLRGVGAANATDQMVRAAESIPANIAEGVGRGVTRDCVRFLRMARASAAELESHLRVASLAGRLASSDADTLVDHVRRVRYLLDRFLKSVEARYRA
ncbi:MAG: four helix bundle protein [Gemmatimonadales bacterium]